MTQNSILVTFADISQGSADCNHVASTIQADLDDLKKFLGPITASWTGSAAVSYQALQARWNTAASDLHRVLVDISQALTTAHNNYSEVERVNHKIWAN